MAKSTIRLCLTVDVEEEGLFGGTYAREDVTVKNVTALNRLESLARRGFPVTLFCAHSVFSDPAACRAVEHARDQFGAEVGAHLHHWNTPPVIPALPDKAGEAAVLVKDMDQDLIRAKMEHLLTAAREFQSAPVTSFRMGRWDMHHWIFPILADLGIKTDASVRPLHYGISHPDHYDAPSQPYRLLANGKSIFEVPLTVSPLWKGLPGCVRRLDTYFGESHGKIMHTVQKWGALAVLPVYHCLPVMKLFALHNFFWSGNTLVLAWHSSEMSPGATAHMPTEHHVASLMRRIHNFLDWLEDRYTVRVCTMDQLRQEYADRAPLKTLADAPDDTVPDWLAI